MKTSLLLHCIGERAREVYNSFIFQSEADSIKYTKVVEQFEAYFGARKNVTYTRFKFFTYRQEPGQPNSLLFFKPRVSFPFNYALDKKSSSKYKFLSALMKVHPIPHDSFETTRSRFIQSFHHCSL